MQLESIILPPYFLNISAVKGNNFFFISQNPTPIFVSDGYYTPQTLIAYLNSTNINIIFTLNDISNNGIGTTTISSTTLPLTDITLIFNTDVNGIVDTTAPLYNKLGWILGFRNGKYTGKTSYISEGLIDLSGYKYLYLVIDDYNNSVSNNFYGALTDSIISPNILARISLLSPPYVENNLSIITRPREYYGPVDLKNLNIRLLDEEGNIVNLTNMDYSFSLLLETVYDI